MASLDSALLDRLLELLYKAKAATVSTESTNMTIRTFEAILEASGQSTVLWEAFKSHMDENSLSRDVLLVEPRMIIRRSIAKSISAKSVYSTG